MDAGQPQPPRDHRASLASVTSTTSEDAQYYRTLGRYARGSIFPDYGQDQDEDPPREPDDSEPVEAVDNHGIDLEDGRPNVFIVDDATSFALANGVTFKESRNGANLRQVTNTLPGGGSVQNGSSNHESKAGQDNSTGDATIDIEALERQRQRDSTLTTTQPATERMSQLVRNARYDLDHEVVENAGFAWLRIAFSCCFEWCFKWRNN
ncbi:hypothetical protein EDC01DRAFT_726435, partial [Geopyxis carbonaria]